MTLIYLAEGDAPLRAARSLRQSMAPVAELMASCFAAAGAVLVNEPGSSYEAGLDQLTKLEEELHKISTFQIPSKEPSTGAVYTEGEIVMADTVIAIVFALGSRIRRLYFVLPEAIHHHDAGAWEAWRRHFKGQKWDFEMGSLPGSPLALQRTVSAARSPMTPRHIARLAASPPTSPSQFWSPRSAGTSPLTARFRKTLRSPRNAAAVVGGGQTTHGVNSPSGRSPITSSSEGMNEFTTAVPSLGGFHGTAIFSGDNSEGGITPRYQSISSPGTAHAVHAAHANHKFGLKRIMSVPPPISAFEEESGKEERKDCGGGTNGSTIYEGDEGVQESLVWTWIKGAAAGVGRWWRGLSKVADLKLPWGFTGEGFVLSLQQSVALAAATIVHVSPASYKALNGNTIWCVVTVAVLAQKSVGGVALRSANRMVGTIAAGITGIG